MNAVKRDFAFRIVLSIWQQHTDTRHSVRLLRACADRPRDRDAAKNRDEIAPIYCFPGRGSLYHIIERDRSCASQQIRALMSQMVKVRHGGKSAPLPLFPSNQTFANAIGMSVERHELTHCRLEANDVHGPAARQMHRDRRARFWLRPRQRQSWVLARSHTTPTPVGYRRNSFWGWLMRRREFITLLGGAAIAWPRVVRAQQPDRIRRIGVLTPFDENDPEAKTYLSAFTQELAELGWIDGRNLRMDVRWAAGNIDRMRMFAKELVDLQPEMILTSSTPVTAALQRETRTIPIVFVFVGDPVGSGFVASLPSS